MSLIGWQTENDNWLVEIGGVWFTRDDEVDAQEKHRKYEVHRRSGKGDERTLPALFGHKFIGRTGGFRVAGVDIGDVLPGHADVAAEWESTDAPVGGTALEAEQTGAEADGEI